MGKRVLGSHGVGAGQHPDQSGGINLLLYMYNYLVAKQSEWKGKTTFAMFTREFECRFKVGDDIKRIPIPSFPGRTFISGGWLGAGLLVNGFSLVWSGLVSIIIIYEAESAVDIVLNALALFFIVDIDNDIVLPESKEFVEQQVGHLIMIRRDAFQYLREEGEYSNFPYSVTDDI